MLFNCPYYTIEDQYISLQLIVDNSLFHNDLLLTFITAKFSHNIGSKFLYVDTKYKVFLTINYIIHFAA